jgi:hypothetical protein
MAQRASVARKVTARGDALCSSVTTSPGMRSIVGLNSSSQASRTFISNVDPQMAGATATARSASSAAANLTLYTSALDISLPPPLLRPTTALRRRGSDGGFPSSRDSSSHHHPKSPSMDSPTEPHPLRRSGTTTRTARHDNDNDNRGNTRPRLSRLVSPSEPVLASPRPLDDPPLQPERAESHRTVLAHKVSHKQFLGCSVSLPPLVPLPGARAHFTYPYSTIGLAKRHARRRSPEIRDLGH